MNIAQKLTIQLIRYEITDISVDKELLEAVTDDVLKSVYTFSVEQDVAYIVGSAISKLGLLSGDIKGAFFNEQLASVYRYEQLQHELNSVSQLFEAEKIAFIPLKGSVIRQYYPKPEMRTSCDIDILIHIVDMGKASKLLMEQLNCKYNDKCSHDISFVMPTGAKLELHFTLCETDSDTKNLLDDVWDYANPADGFKYKHELKKEFFMLYHMYHIAKHICSGGCGLRPFLDTYILEQKLEYNKQQLTDLYSKAGLVKLAKGVLKTAMVWFGNETEDETTRLMGNYIFDAGIYGNIENQVAVSQGKNGSRFRTLINRIFMPYKQLKVVYPIIVKYPVLTPVFEIKRWGRIIFKDKMKKQMAIIKYNATITEEKQNEVAKLMKNLDLM